MDDSYVSGYLEKTKEGKYEGEIKVEGISLSPISGVMFKQNGKVYLWLKRKDMLVYDHDRQTYIARKREPRWEVYLEKQLKDEAIAFRGEFVFMRFRFSIVGTWDKVLGRGKNRINFFVERLPMNRQNIINSISKNRS